MIQNDVTCISFLNNYNLFIIAFSLYHSSGTESNSTLTTFPDPKTQNNTTANSEGKKTTAANLETLNDAANEGVTDVVDTKKNGTKADSANEDATDFTASTSDEDSETKATALATNQIVTLIVYSKCTSNFVILLSCAFNFSSKRVNWKSWVMLTTKMVSTQPVNIILTLFVSN